MLKSKQTPSVLIRELIWNCTPLSGGTLRVPLTQNTRRFSRKWKSDQLSLSFLTARISRGVLLFFATGLASLFVDGKELLLELDGDVTERIPANAIIRVLEGAEFAVVHLVGADLVHGEESTCVAEVEQRGL